MRQKGFNITSNNGSGGIEMEKKLLNDFYGLEEERQLELPTFKVDVYELRSYEKAYDFPEDHSSYQFTVNLYKTLASADVSNYEKLAAVYPEEAYMVAYKEKPQFLKYFILWDRINDKEVTDWK